MGKELREEQWRRRSGGRRSRAAQPSPNAHRCCCSLLWFGSGVARQAQQSTSHQSKFRNGAGGWLSNSDDCPRRYVRSEAWWRQLPRWAPPPVCYSGQPLPLFTILSTTLSLSLPLSSAPPFPPFSFSPPRSASRLSRDLDEQVVQLAVGGRKREREREQGERGCEEESHVGVLLLVSFFYSFFPPPLHHQVL